MKKNVVTLRYASSRDALNELLTKAHNVHARSINLRKWNNNIEILFSSYFNKIAASSHGKVLHQIPLENACARAHSYAELCQALDSSDGQYLNPQQMWNQYRINPFWKVESKNGRFGICYRLSQDNPTTPITDNFQS